LKEMPSSGSYITYKILNSIIPPRDLSYLQARLIKVLLHELYMTDIFQYH